MVTPSKERGRLGETAVATVPYKASMIDDELVTVAFFLTVKYSQVCDDEHLTSGCAFSASAWTLMATES